MKKAITDYNEVTDLINDDLLLLQRSDEYYKIKSQNLGGGLFKTVVTLTVSELQALNTTPIDLIDTPGTGKVIDLISAFAYRNGAAFTATDPQLKLRYSSAGSTEQYETSATFLTVVGNTRIERFTIDDKTMVVNNSIQAHLDNNVTTATGSVTIYIIYRIITL